MSYNPITAADDTSYAPREFTNIARLTRCEVQDANANYKAAIGAQLDDYVPMWDVTFECLDAQYADGNPLVLRFGTKFFDKNGKPLGPDQRPTVQAQGFADAGFPISFATEGDMIIPQSFDGLIGHVFEVANRLVPSVASKKSPIVVGYIGDSSYEFPGTPRILNSTGSRSNETVNVAAEQGSTEIIGNDDLTAQLASLLDGVPNNKTSVRNALRTANFGTGLTLNGQGVVGLAVTGGLIAETTAAGITLSTDPVTLA